jgi:hypothetical protein
LNVYFERSALTLTLRRKKFKIKYSGKKQRRFPASLAQQPLCAVLLSPYKASMAQAKIVVTWIPTFRTSTCLPLTRRPTFPSSLGLFLPSLKDIWLELGHPKLILYLQLVQDLVVVPKVLLPPCLALVAIGGWKDGLLWSVHQVHRVH